jgi:hypothetical protein
LGEFEYGLQQGTDGPRLRLLGELGDGPPALKITDFSAAAFARTSRRSFRPALLAFVAIPFPGFMLAALHGRFRFG